ncbi:hypothetical protein quinque_014515 [Culex quinquefasciatus]
MNEQEKSNISVAKELKLNLPKQITITRGPAKTTADTTKCRRSSIPIFNSSLNKSSKVSVPQSNSPPAAKASVLPSPLKSTGQNVNPQPPMKKVLPSNTKKTTMFKQHTEQPADQTQAAMSGLPMTKVHMPNPHSAQSSSKSQSALNKIKAVELDVPINEEQKPDVMEVLAKIVCRLDIIEKKVDFGNRSNERHNRVLEELRKDIFKFRDDVMPVDIGIIKFPIADDKALHSLEDYSRSPEGERTMVKKFFEEGTTADDLVKRTIDNLFTNTSKFTWTGQSSHNTKDGGVRLQASTLNLLIILQGGVLVAQKDFYAPKHSELEQIPNRHAIKMMQSLKL